MIISSKQMAKSKPVLDLSESYVIRDAAKVSTFIEKHRSLLSDAYMEIHRCLPGAQVFLDIVRYTGEKDRQEFVISILTHLSPDAAVGSLRKSWRESSRQVQARLHVKLVHCGARGLLRTYGLFGPEPEQESTTLEEIIGMNLSVTPEVERVLVSREGEGIAVWSIVNKASDEVRYQIYRRERATMDLFPELGFDFHVIDRRGRPVDELISGVSAAFERR